MSGIRQVGIRLKPEGGDAVVREVKDVEKALEAMNAKAVSGANSAVAASKRTVEQLRIEAGAAKAAESALQRQINAATGVSASANPVSKKYQAAESRVLDRSAARLLAEIEPARVAQDRLNTELAEYDLLLKRNKISIDQHAAAQALARKRYDDTTNALKRQGDGLSRNERASRLNLMRQGSDVFVTAAMGMNPAMIAIQQGPQIMDAWATSGIKTGASLLALAGTTAILAGAVIGLGAAYLTGEKSALAYERAATGVGRTAKMTGEQLREAAQAGAEAAGISIKSAQEQAAAYVSTGRIGGEVLQGLIAIGKDYASFMGVDAKTATQQLATAFKDPATAARDMTREFGLLDQKTLKLIEDFQKQGDRLAAQKLLLEALTAAVQGHGDKVGEITSFWDAAARAVSNYWQKAGEALYETDEERLDKLRETANGRGGNGKVGVSPWEQQQAQLQVDREERRIGVQNIADWFRSENAASNQAEQDKKDEEDKKKDKKKSGGKSAEQLAREAEQRRRREEDYQAGLEMQIARSNEDVGETRRLEDEARIRQRIRQLVDDGTAAEEARKKAIEEVAPLLSARADADQRGRDALQRATEQEVMRLNGQTRNLEASERQEELEKRIKEYRELGLGVTSEVREVMDGINGLTSEIVVTDHAILQARKDMLAIDTARAEVLKRANEEAEREHQLNLARLSGNEDRYKELDYYDRIERRAREIERRNGWNDGEGAEQARREIDAELNAEATGARKQWIRGLLGDIKNGGIGEALARQLDKATDHWLDKLSESLANLDWGGFVQALLGGFSGGAGGGSGGGWGKAFGVLFGEGLGKGSDAQSHGEGNEWWRSLFGGHAAGTEFSDGGWKWVGENGKELMRVPRGAQVMDHNRSMMFAGSQKGGGALSIGTLKVVNNGSEKMEASAKMSPEGDLELILEPIIDRRIGQSGRNGGLNRALRQTPQTIKR